MPFLKRAVLDAYRRGWVETAKSAKRAGGKLDQARLATRDFESTTALKYRGSARVVKVANRFECNVAAGVCDAAPWADEVHKVCFHCGDFASAEHTLLACKKLESIRSEVYGGCKRSHRMFRKIPELVRFVRAVQRLRRDSISVEQKLLDREFGLASSSLGGADLDSD